MSKKIGRNDPCPCGSGKKYKHCCMDKDKKNSNIFQFPNSGSRNGQSGSSQGAPDNPDMQRLLDMFGFSSQEEMDRSLKDYGEWAEKTSSQPGMQGKNITTFSEFSGRGANLATETVKEISGRLSEMEFSSKEEADAFLKQFNKEHNSSPLDSFLGLSPNQMKRLLQLDFIDLQGDLVRLNEKLQVNDVLEAPMLKKLRYLFDMFKENDGRLPLTQSGYLRPVYVKQYHKHFYGEDPMHTWVKQENQVRDLVFLRNFLAEFELINKRVTFIELNEKTYDYIDNGDWSALYILILFHLIDNISWNFFLPPWIAELEEMEFIQNSALFSLFMMRKKAVNFISQQKIYDYFTTAFPYYDPIQKSELFDNASKKRYSDAPVLNMYKISYLNLFLDFFAAEAGLIEERKREIKGDSNTADSNTADSETEDSETEDSETEEMSSRQDLSLGSLTADGTRVFKEYRITPLFRKLFIWFDDPDF